MSAVLPWGAFFVVLAAALPGTASPAEVHFSPDEGIRRHLLHAIRESRQQIDVAVYQFTSTDLADALTAAKRRGVRVRVLTDQERAASGGAALRTLREQGVEVRRLGVPEQSLMHHKFAVFDGRLLATGSYNWTRTAERANYENLVLIDDRDLVARFQREFQRLWQAAKE
jgi:phosphatidylserine/phosphatidylglycerophosphate/cardiolipin synthase-like enzyme